MGRALAVIAGSDGDVGSAVVARFIAAGWAVATLSRAARRSVPKATSLRADLADEAQVAAVASRLAAHDPALRCVVNCAGYYERTARQADNQAVRANNFHVAELLLKHFTPLLRDVDGARFITVSSIDGRFLNPNAFAYSIDKAAINALVGLYRKSHRSDKVNFDLILPGAINTRMRADKEENKEALIQPADIADLCLFLSRCPSSVCYDDITMYPKSFSYAN